MTRAQQIEWLMAGGVSREDAEDYADLYERAVADRAAALAPSAR